MRWTIVAFVLCACGAGQRTGGSSGPVDPAEFAAKLAARDVGAVRALMRDEVSYGGILFSDPACAKQFGAPGTLAGAALDELARCLTTLALAPATRKDELPDVAVLTYPPGIELEARFAEDARGPWLRAIGYVAPESGELAPTIAPATLESLRIAGAPDGPLPDNVDVADELALSSFVWAWLKVCVDGDGSVSRTHVREASSPRVARLVEAAVKAWKFKPFTVGAQPVAACSLVRVAYPAADADAEVLPLVQRSPDQATTVPSIMLGARRSGSTNIAPDDRTRIELSDAGIRSLVSAFHFCLDEAGRVTTVTPLRATGYASYDKALTDAIRTWQYAPFRDEGKPVAVCSTVRFVYNQR